MMEQERPAKIACMLSSVHPPLDVRIYHRECKTLARAGYEVVFIVPSAKSISSDGVRIVCVSPEENRFGRMTRVAWKIYGLAKRENANVYHIHDPELIPIGLLLRAAGRCVIYDAHEDLPSDILDKPWIPKWSRRPVAALTAWLEFVACRCCSAVVTADDPIADRLSSLGKRPVTLNNYPLAAEFANLDFSTRARASSNLIVSFGGLYEFRAVFPIVDSLELISEGLPIKLVLGGAAESDATLDDVRARPGWRRVDYRGQVSRPQMLSELSRAFAAIVLFRQSPNTGSVRSNRLYEALAAGLPVITAKHGEWRSFVEGNECGLAVDPEDPKKIAWAIEWLFSHPEEASAMGHRGRELFLRKFNWEREGEKLTHLYASLTDQPVASPVKSSAW